MPRQLLVPALTFLLGLAVGGLALGQKPATPGIAEGTPESPEPLRGGSAFVEDEAADSSPAGPTETPGSEAGALTIELGPMSETEQIRMLIAGWSDLEARLGLLAERVNGLELLVAAARQPGTTEQPQSEAGQAIGVLPTDTPENRRRALVAAGVSAAEAEEIVWRQSDQQLGRLELQDRAVDIETVSLHASRACLNDAIAHEDDATIHSRTAGIG